MYFCRSCNFQTSRKKHFDRHLQSEQHLKLAFIFGDEDEELPHESHGGSSSGMSGTGSAVFASMASV